MTWHMAHRQDPHGHVNSHGTHLWTHMAWVWTHMAVLPACDGSHPDSLAVQDGKHHWQDITVSTVTDHGTWVDESDSELLAQSASVVLRCHC